MTPIFDESGIELYLGDCVKIMRAFSENSVDAIVTDPPYGLEFMNKTWDTLRIPSDGDGFRRRDNPNDVDRGSVHGRLSRTSPEYKTGHRDDDAWRAGGGFSAPGIGDRSTAWTSFGGRDTANATCETCGGRMRGAKKCFCFAPEWRVKGKAVDPNDTPRARSRDVQMWHYTWAVETLRVLKPGGYLLAFGGTRTHHRLMCAIEDAGFEIKDSVAWMHGQGFPKSLDVSKAFDKAAGATRTIVGRRAGRAATRKNDIRGGKYVGSTRTIDLSVITAPATNAARQWDGWGTALKPAFEIIVMARKPLAGSSVTANVARYGTGAIHIDACRVSGGRPSPSRDGEQVGRWPANVVLDEHAARMLDEQVGDRTSKRTETPSACRTDGVTPFDGMRGDRPPRGFNDTGGASRFFYCPKADTKERKGSRHPTVKPLALCAWLVRLVTPPNGVILDPFMGSGTIVQAARTQGFRAIGIDQDEIYVRDAVQRMTESFVGETQGEKMSLRTRRVISRQPTVFDP